MQQATSSIKKRIIRHLHRMDAKKLVSDSAPNATYSSWNILQTIILAAMWGTFIESTTQRLKHAWNVLACSGDNVFTRLKNTLKKTGLDNAVGFNRDIIRQAKRRGLFRKKVVVAIDYWDREYYGKRRDANCSGGEHKNGTSWFYRVATLCVVENGLRFEVAMVPVRLFARSETVVEALLKEAIAHIKIKAVLLDRGFNSAAVIRAIESLNLKYIMPMQKNDRILRIIDETRGLWLNVVQRYQFTLRTELYVRLLIVNSELLDGKALGSYYAYITNLTVECNKSSVLTVAELYESRWGIETGYRVKKWEFRAKTCSESAEVRFFLILLSIILFNIWTLLRTLAQEFHDIELTAYMFKENFIVEIVSPET